MQKIVIIGADSYLAAGLNSYLPDISICYLHFYDWMKHIDVLQSADCVINFSIAPEFSTSDMDIKDIIDVKIAERLKTFKTQYIFISSRKVYGSDNEIKIYRETDKLTGIDFYAKNKIKTEHKLSEILTDNLTILRVSNIVGEPIYRRHYKTFMGWICENIIQNQKLIVTQNENAVKDFITKNFLHQNIAQVITQRLTGIYNLSAGFGTSVKNILCGYAGSENIIFAGSHEKIHDEFILDNSKLCSLTKIYLSPEELYSYLHLCQKQLLEMTYRLAKNKNAA